MKFLEAIEAMKQGKQVKRECWVKTDGYLTLMPDMKNVWKILIHPTPNAGNHIFSVEEICAEDYDIYSGYHDECSKPCAQECEADAA